MTEIPNSGERALDRMRRYTTISLVGVFGAFLLMTVIGSTDLLSQVLYAVSGLLVMAQAFYWEKGPPLWLGITTIVVAYLIWVWSVGTGHVPFSGVLAAVAIAMHTAFPRHHRSWWIIAGGATLAGPLVAAVLLTGTTSWNPWFIAVVGGYLGAIAFFLLNTYAFNLYLEIDAARRTGEELAVAQERYRFAADLHDIQGHTLHVLRLKIQLADRLIDRDPDAAHTHLAEAQMLIAETVANTRSLAFGDRHVAVASELANARELFGAAGIDCVVHGEVSTHGQEELFGLVVREVTTNILRHSQATAVTVRLGDGLVVITNDGSPEGDVKLSGLARLSDRFAAAGGTLTASTHGGRFTTEALIPNAAILSSTGSRGRAAL